MRTTLLSLAAATLLAVPASAVTYLNNFHKVYDPLTGNLGKEIKRTGDGGYVVVGEMVATFVSLPGSRPMVLKLDSNFAIQWDTTYLMASDFGSGFLGFLSAEDISQTFDGGYIVCGRYVEEFVMDGSYLMRLDWQGNVMWFQAYQNIQELHSVIQRFRADGLDGFMACGLTYVNGYATPTILRTDGNGAVEWIRYVWALENDRTQWHGDYRQIIPFADYFNNPTSVLVGNVNQYVSGCGARHSDVLVTIVDTFGNIGFNRVYGQGDIIGGNHLLYSTWETGHSIAHDPVTDDLAIVGNVASYPMEECGPPPAYNSLLAFKINSSGTVLWANRYSVMGTDTALRVLVSGKPDRRLLVAGESTTNLLGAGFSPDALLLQLTNAAGNVLGGEVFGGGQSDTAPALAENFALNPVLLANTQSFSAGQNLVYLIEQYQHKQRRCNDRGVTVDRIPVPLPTNLPFEDWGQTPALLVPVFAVNPFIAQTVLCNKVEITISIDPISVSGVSPSPWNP